MYLAMAISLGAYAFFNMPQQMMQMGSQMMMPPPQNPPCNCTCTTP